MKYEPYHIRSLQIDEWLLFYSYKKHKEIISIFHMAGLIAKKNQAKLAEQIYKQTHCE